MLAPRLGGEVTANGTGAAGPTGVRATGTEISREVRSRPENRDPRSSSPWRGHRNRSDGTRTASPGARRGPRTSGDRPCGGARQDRRHHGEAVQHAENARYSGARRLAGGACGSPQPADHGRAKPDSRVGNARDREPRAADPVTGGSDRRRDERGNPPAHPGDRGAGALDQRHPHPRGPGQRGRREHAYRLTRPRARAAPAPAASRAPRAVPWTAIASGERSPHQQESYARDHEARALDRDRDGSSGTRDVPGRRDDQHPRVLDQLRRGPAGRFGPLGDARQFERFPLLLAGGAARHVGVDEGPLGQADPARRSVERLPPFVAIDARRLIEIPR